MKLIYIERITWVLHIMLIVSILNPYNIYNVEKQGIVILSWEINRGYCIITELEHKYFGRGMFSKELKPVSRKERLLAIIILIYKIIKIKRVHNL